MVISILGLAAGCAICGIGSWIVFANQPDLAVKAIQKQLIPWVESSHLAPADKESVVLQLGDLANQIESGAYDKSQLRRLRNCLQDNPVLLWGGIQSIENQSTAAGLTELEVESLRRLNQRLLRAATERHYGRRDLEFTLQVVSKVSQDGSHLEVLSDLDATQIRSFMQRAESLVSRSQVPNEPFEKTPSEAFALLVDAALKEEATSASN
jgi:hypothetical protein